MYRVLHGFEAQQADSSSGHSGCLLADDMGLGKSLQSLAGAYTRPPSSST